MSKKVDVPLDLNLDTFIGLAETAHKKDITFNHMVNKLMKKAMKVDKRIINLVKEELQRLQHIRKLEGLGLDVFDKLYWGTYAALELLLDTICIPIDDIESRDTYFDLYSYIWFSDDTISKKTVKKLIKNINKSYLTLHNDDETGVV